MIVSSRREVWDTVSPVQGCAQFDMHTHSVSLFDPSKGYCLFKGE